MPAAAGLPLTKRGELRLFANAREIETVDLGLNCAVKMTLS